MTYYKLNNLILDMIITLSIYIVAVLIAVVVILFKILSEIESIELTTRNLINTEIKSKDIIKNIELVQPNQMTTDEIESQLKSIISNILGDEKYELTSDTKFIDLDFDSLDRIELIYTIELLFNIVIHDSDINNINTISDAVKYLENLKSN